jgi:hypothetical protein
LHEQWRDFHKQIGIEVDPNDPRPQNKYLWHEEGNQVWQHCTVSEADFEPGFPCIGKDMPRAKK